MPAMEIVFNDKRKDAFEIIITGKLDIAQAEEFEQSFGREVKTSKDNIVGLNLSKITYIDSSGLGSLIKVLNSAKSLGKTLVLFGATEKIESFFHVARLDKFFKFQKLTDFLLQYPEDDDML